MNVFMFFASKAQVVCMSAHIFLAHPLENRVHLHTPREARAATHLTRIFSPGCSVLLRLNLGLSLRNFVTVVL